MEDFFTGSHKSQGCKSTIRRDFWAVRTFSTWAAQRKKRIHFGDAHDLGDVKKLETMSSAELNNWMKCFVREVRKVDGREYPSKSLVSLVLGIQRYLQAKGKKVDFIYGSEYEDFHSVFSSHVKFLNQKDYLNAKTSHAQLDSITEAEEDMLWDGHFFGDFNPTVLLRTLIYLNCKHFGLRAARLDHRSLSFHQLAIVNIDGKRALKYTEDLNRWKPGALKRVRIQNRELVHFADVNKPERCHVRMMEKYIALRPFDAGPFYLQPLKHYTDVAWFCEQPMGHNTLSKVIAEIYKAAKLEAEDLLTKDALSAKTLIKTEMLPSDEDEENSHETNPGFNCDEVSEANHDEKYHNEPLHASDIEMNQWKNWPNGANVGNEGLAAISFTHTPNAEQDFTHVSQPLPLTSACPESVNTPNFATAQSMEQNTTWTEMPHPFGRAKDPRAEAAKNISEVAQAKKHYFQRLLEMAEEQHLAKLKMLEAKRRFYEKKTP